MLKQSTAHARDTINTYIVQSMAFVTFRGPSPCRRKNLPNAQAKWRVYATWRMYTKYIECRMTKKHDYKFISVIFCIILASIYSELPHKIQKVTKKCPDWVHGLLLKDVVFRNDQFLQLKDSFFLVKQKLPKLFFHRLNSSFCSRCALNCFSV